MPFVKSNLTDESLITLMCEVEAIINSRLLTTVSNDPGDLKPLTPNHLLLMKTNSSLPPGVFDPTDVYSRKQWRQVQYLANVFWSRWLKKYSPTLQLRQKWTRTHRNLSINDVVLIVDEGLPRNIWLMGRVLETFPDSFGHVRTARVLTKNSVFLLHITRLVLLIPALDES